jgi:cobalt-zinc-cadmium efflux system membrane fusion protein
MRVKIVDALSRMLISGQTFCGPIAVGLWIGGMAVGIIACGNRPEEPPPPKPVVASEQSGHLRLTAEERSRMTLEVVPVSRGVHRAVREFPATIQANHNELAEVTTLIRGRVVKVHVDVGQDVKKGTLLALLHSMDLGVVEGDYLKAGARLHEAELAHARAKELYDNKAVSLAELQRREAAMKTAQAERRETKNRLELLGVPREEIDRLDRELTIKADVSIRAPFDGRVIMRNLTRGEVIETDQKLFTVADLSDVWVIANVPEKDVAFIKKDQTVEMVAAAYPHAVFGGTITYVGDVLDPATRTMRVRITAPNPDRLLKPEMFALVRVYAAPEPAGLTVPLAAIQTGSAGKIVFVERVDGEFEVRPVRLGEEYGNTVMILEGVREGERVVAGGSFALKSELERYKIEATP